MKRLLSILTAIFVTAATPLSAVTLIGAAASLAASGRIGKARGQIQHPEFRQATTPDSIEQHQHHDYPPEIGTTNK